MVAKQFRSFSWMERSRWVQTTGVSAVVIACILLTGCARRSYPIYSPPPVIIVHHGYGGYGYGGSPVIHVYHRNSPYGYHPYGSGVSVVHVYHHYRH